jgi:phosphonate C-P lyase system protein PhnG
MDIDLILCECPPDDLKSFVSSMENQFDINIIKHPSICMTMIQAEDSVELQPFYLGEALTTECQLIVNGQIGYGICLGDEPVRAYCIAFMDAVIQLKQVDLAGVKAFLYRQQLLIEEARIIEHNQILQTKVDFKLMEQN